MHKIKNVILIMIFLLFAFNNKSFAKEVKRGIENFPVSYQGYLYELKQNHPNWNFNALYTGLNWNDAISNENVFTKNLVPISYSDNWKNTNPAYYNVQVDSNWVDASRQAILYTMDPRNFLNNVRIFQFEDNSYNEAINRKDLIEKILYGTEFYNKQVDFLDSLGNRIYTDSTYSDLIANASKLSNVSSFNLASRIKQEVGPFLSHKSISGDVEGYEGLYNFYNIGATSSQNAMETIKRGLQYARDGKGASENIKTLYLIPWNTKEKAISGGAIFLGRTYINAGQNSIYLQKFNVADDNVNKLYFHQYMTNVLAPYSESLSIYKGYSNTNLLESNLSFIIPVFDNMPEINTESPNINTQDYVQDNSNVIAKVTTTLNIRSGPSTNYESLTKVNSSSKITRISKCIGSGELWDRVILDNGIVGYAFQNYLEEVPQNELNENELKFDTSLRVSNFEISNLPSINTVSKIKEKVNTTHKIEFQNQNGNILGENDLVGTGSRLKILDDNVTTLTTYKFILYGDVNGDGKISSVDLLVLQRHILEIKLLQDVYYKAGNINKNGKKPSSYDSLLIQRHILGYKAIEQ